MRAILSAGLAIMAVGWADTRVNADSQIVADFMKRVSDYQQMEKGLEDKLPKLRETDSLRAIAHEQHALAGAIREARKNARQGDIFTPKISSEFRRLAGLAMQGNNAARILKSLQDSEPVKIPLRVGDAYPSDVPQQSTPPTLLMNLPALPRDLQYRLSGKTLILLDSKANLVVDLMPNAIQ